MRSCEHDRGLFEIALIALPDAGIGLDFAGGEVTADAIRDASRRRDAPFIGVDCGAPPANLLESELFDHERGAFTSAGQARAARSATSIAAPSANSTTSRPRSSTYSPQLDARRLTRLPNLLEQPEKTPENDEGFGCMECYPQGE